MTKRLLITGERRSGTTLLARLLTAQPDISIKADAIHIQRIAQRLGVGLADALNEAQTTEAHRLANADGAPVGLAVAHTIAHGASLLCLRDEWLHDLCAMEGASVIGHKTTFAHDAIKPILDNGDEEHVIYIHRDPRAVAASIIKLGWDNAYTAALAWRHSWASKPGGQPRLYVLWFDLLVADPYTVCHDLCAWLGVPFDAGRVPVVMGEHNSAFGSAAGAIDRGKRLTPKQTSIVESLCHDQLIDAGYKLTRRRGRLERLRYEAMAMAVRGLRFGGRVMAGIERRLVG